MSSFLRQWHSFIPFTPYSYKGEHIACDICGCRRAEHVSSYDRRLKRLTSVGCLHCGLIRTDPMPTDKELGQYYATAYRKDYQWSVTPPKAHIARSRKEAAARLSFLNPKLKASSKILDIGCGAGEFLAAASREGHRCVGLEPGEGFAAYARSTHGIEIHQCSWQDADLPRGHFDVISLHHVLEHLREPVRTLEKLHTWLADDGVLYVAVPDFSAKREQSFQYFHFAHIYHFSRSTLLAAAMVAGFELEPSIPSTSTVVVLRKRVAGPLPRADVPHHSERFSERFPSPQPLAFLLSGQWVVHALRRLKKSLRDSWLTVP